MSGIGGGPIEAKAAAAPTVTLIAGYLAGLLIQIVPWLKDNLTPDQVQNLPIIIAFGLSALAAYLAPHTHRPDLAPPVEPEQPKHAARAQAP